MIRTKWSCVDRDDHSAERHEGGTSRGTKHNAHSRQYAGGEWDRDDTVTGRPRQVLDHPRSRIAL